jgi:hypothetical protein
MVAVVVVGAVVLTSVPGSGDRHTPSPGAGTPATGAPLARSPTATGAPASGAPSAPPTAIVQPTPGPVTTGHPVTPASPGASPVLTADSVPFNRPMFNYLGSEPWQISARPHDAVVLEGYASRPSYLPGDVLRLAVSTSAPTFDLSIWRLSGAAPSTGPFVRVGELRGLQGRRQGPSTVEPVTKLVAARWAYDVVYPIPGDWPSAVYLVRLASSESVQSYVPFVLRSSTAHHLLVVSNAMTWEA